MIKKTINPDRTTLASNIEYDDNHNKNVGANDNNGANVGANQEFGANE